MCGRSGFRLYLLLLVFRSQCDLFSYFGNAHFIKIANTLMTDLFSI